VITGVEIQGLRGIRTGKLEGLTPLTVLVGPSGAGKSTILDALLIAASRSPGDAIGRVIQRRADLFRAAPWLFERQGSEAIIKLHGDVERVCKLRWTPNAPSDLVASLPAAEQSRSPVCVVCSAVTNQVGVEGGPITSDNSRVVVSTGNAYSFDDDFTGIPNPAYRATSESFPLPKELDARLIEPAAGATGPLLYRLFSEADEQGRLDDVISVLGEVLEGAEDLRIHTVPDSPFDRPVLHIAFADYTIPVAAAGSGVYALVRLALDLAAERGGLALVEEPEAHEHPASIHRSAKVLLTTARRGVQIVVSTHSIELIDSLVALATDEDLARLSVIRMVLDQGTLRTSSFPGPMVATARGSLDEDLR
jgi:energy-coupling factor transporter ATP-binding protein EcfA2